MKNVLLTIASMISVTLNAQYYYNDILGTQEINSKMKSYLIAKVESVSATGFDPQGMKTPDFNEWQDIQENAALLKITTRNGQNVSRVYYQFDNKTRLINSRDSSGEIQNSTTYSYDAAGNLVNIKLSRKDSLHDFDETEERQWIYNAAGRPEKMLRTVNGTDSTEYRFSPDEHGNVADETLFRRFGGPDTVYYFYENTRVYYYYDEQNRLTDIVRFNKKAKQLLPDVMFEYDDSNRVIQRITTVSLKNPDYFIWRYVFNGKGLKIKEAMFNKFKQIKGKIEYAYTFAP